MRQKFNRLEPVPRIAFDLVDEIHADSGGVGEVVLLRASGEVDFAAGPQLRERLFAHIGHARSIVLDLSAVTFIDSMAIGVLVGAATRTRDLGAGTLSVVCSSENERVLRIFDIAGVVNLITLHRTTRDALAATVPAAPRQRRDQGAQTATAMSAVAAGAPSRSGVARRYSPTHIPPGAVPDSGVHRVDELA